MQKLKSFQEIVPEPGSWQVVTRIKDPVGTDLPGLIDGME